MSECVEIVCYSNHDQVISKPISFLGLIEPRFRLLVLLVQTLSLSAVRLRVTLRELVNLFLLSLLFGDSGCVKLDQVTTEHTVKAISKQIVLSLSSQSSKGACQILLQLEVGLLHLVLEAANISGLSNNTLFLLQTQLLFLLSISLFLELCESLGLSSILLHQRVVLTVGFLGLLLSDSFLVGESVGCADQLYGKHKLGT